MMIEGGLLGESEDVGEGGECCGEWSSVGKWGSVFVMRGEMVQLMRDGEVMQQVRVVT